jgi:hypothetical protein
MDLDSVNDELYAAKTMFCRAWVSQKLWEEQHGESSAEGDIPGNISATELEAVEHEVRQETDKDGNRIELKRRKTIRRKKDFSEELAKWTNKVKDLTKLRAELLQTTQAEDTVDRISRELRASGIPAAEDFEGEDDEET